jgi:lipopolysaccharide export system protein LptC
VRSHQPVTLTRCNDRFTGDSLAYDHIAQVLELQGRVRGQLSPKK